MAEYFRGMTLSADLARHKLALITGKDKNGNSLDENTLHSIKEYIARIESFPKQTKIQIALSYLRILRYKLEDTLWRFRKWIKKYKLVL